MQCQSIDELRRSETHREKNCISCVSFLYLCWYTCLAPSFHHVFVLSVAIIIRASWQAALPCISDPDDVYMLIANSNTRYLFRIQTSIRFYDCPFDLNKRSMRSVWPIPFTLSSMIIAINPPPSNGYTLFQYENSLFKSPADYTLLFALYALCVVLE